MKQISKEALIDILHVGGCVIKFVKKDGSNRDMNCTLNPTYLRENNALPKEKKDPDEIVVDTPIIRVYDIDNKGWRSFDYNTIRWNEMGIGE